MPLPLRIVDSVTELGPADAGCVAVTGSHGGVSSSRYAIAARPLLTVFNDAGVGLDAAGIVGLDLLQAQGLAACTVLHSSARIGDARSSLADGIIGHANALAVSLGVRTGMRCTAAVALVRGTSEESVCSETAPSPAAA